MTLELDPLQDIVLLAAGLERIRLAVGEVLFRQGDRGDAMYMLTAGQMDIQVQVADVEERVLCTLEPHAIIGEISLLLDEPRIATLVARTNAELCRISRADFRTAITQGDRWASGLLLIVARNLARRLTSTNEDLVAIIAKTFQESQPGLVAEILARRLTSTNKDLVVLIAKMLEKSQPGPVAEIEQLCDRLLRQWSF
jgi:CRP-like cAMP-binding protein